jgi:prepilin-type N-terminal cleavage/methylation domain-containing protein/prepilin-type processing-associated H-X9-DG protein
MRGEKELKMERQKRNSGVGLVRPGFTLVELLVVITIIGMLMALLMPAISAAREQGRRTKCMSNQKELGTAMLAFEQSQKAFPGWRNVVTVPTGTRLASWIAMLLPQMERADLWQIYKTTMSTPSVSINLLICPSDPPDSTTNLGPSAYIANGLVLRDQYLYKTMTDPKFTVLAPQTLDYISGADGTTNTLMLGENTRSTLPPGAPAGSPLKAHNWYDVDNSALTALSLTTSTFLKQTFGFPLTAANNPNTSPAQPYYPPNLPTFAAWYGSQPGFTNNQMTANIASAHGSGAMVTFFDGHGQFLRDDVGLMLNATTPATPATGNANISIYQVLVSPEGSKNMSEPPADEGEWSGR